MLIAVITHKDYTVELDGNECERLWSTLADLKLSFQEENRSVMFNPPYTTLALVSEGMDLRTGNTVRIVFEYMTGSIVIEAENPDAFLNVQRDIMGSIYPTE